MGRYSKLFGAVLGGIVGIGLVALGVSETDLPQYQALIDTIVATATSALGTYLAPKNA